MRTRILLNILLFYVTQGQIVQSLLFSPNSSQSLIISSSLRQSSLTCLLEPPTESKRSYSRWRRYLKCTINRPEASPSPFASPSQVVYSENELGVCSSMNGIPVKRKNVRMRRYIQCLWKYAEQPGDTATRSSDIKLNCENEPPPWSSKRAMVRWRRYIVLEPNCPIARQENVTAKAEKLESRAVVDLTGDEYLQRLLYVYLLRSRAWVIGIKPGHKCEVHGKRCSLGYYCKCARSFCTCRLLKIPQEIIVSDAKEQMGMFNRAEGMPCFILMPHQCRYDLECRHFSGYQYYCVPKVSVHTVALNFTDHQLSNHTIQSETNSSESVATPVTAEELITKPDENSHIKANEYEGRGLLVYNETLHWVQGLTEGSSCSPNGDRCSMGLLCKEGQDRKHICRF